VGVLAIRQCDHDGGDDGDAKRKSEIIKYLFTFQEAQRRIKLRIPDEMG
jgi:hypothetical protein